MSIRFLDVSEFFLLQSFKFERITLENPTVFKVDDHMVFIIDQKIAALAKVVSYSADAVNLFFIHMTEPEERPTISGSFREHLVEDFGIQFSNTMFQKTIDNENRCSFYLHFFDSYHNSLHYYFTEIDFLYEETYQKESQKRKKEYHEKQRSKLIETVSFHPEATKHTKSQHMIKEIGTIVGCNTWIASNDQNREFKGEKLGVNAMSCFPNLNIDKEIKDRIALIDTIWFNGDLPIACFETETTTSIYSGILRISDLISVMPSVDIKLYIVAPNERKEKVLSEMNRPLFQRIGLTDYCKFVPLESLEILWQKVKGLNGHISPSVIDAIAISPVFSP